MSTIQAGSKEPLKSPVKETNVSKKALPGTASPSPSLQNWLCLMLFDYIGHKCLLLRIGYMSVLCSRAGEKSISSDGKSALHVVSIWRWKASRGWLVVCPLQVCGPPIFAIFSETPSNVSMCMWVPPKVKLPINFLLFSMKRSYRGTFESTPVS